jgi:hypothetical protein
MCCYSSVQDEVAAVVVGLVQGGCTDLAAGMMAELACKGSTHVRTWLHVHAPSHTWADPARNF